MKALKKLFCRISVFLYSTIGSAMIVFLVTGSVRCCIHFMDGTIPNIFEWIGLVAVMLIGGVVGFALYWMNEEDL